MRCLRWREKEGVVAWDVGACCQGRQKRGTRMGISRIWKRMHWSGRIESGRKSFEY